MAISKRLRFEILRRDDFRCRYCGLTASEIELQVDHVIPESLGGDDEPGNLVTACEPCNSGKSSAPLDGPKVAEIAADAERWASAIVEVARRRQEGRQELKRWLTRQWFSAADGLLHLFDENEQLITRSGPSVMFTDIHEYPHVWMVKGPPRPKNAVDQVSAFLAAGLDREMIVGFIATAMNSPAGRDDKWRYFCGCCWREIRSIQDEAMQLLRDEDGST